jgi:hypothetical protein
MGPRFRREAAKGKRGLLHVIAIVGFISSETLKEALS